MYWLLIFILITYSSQNIIPINKDMNIIEATTYPTIPVILEFDPKVGDREYDIYEMELPEGWVSNSPARFQNPIRIIITPPDTSAGLYIIPIRFIDEYEINPLPTKTVLVYVNVSRDLFRVRTEGEITGNYKQPVRFRVEIESKAPATYIIEARSYNNRFLKEVYVKDRYGQLIEFIYPFEGDFKIDLEVRPKYSSTMKYRTEIIAKIREDLFMDFQAYKYGALLYFQQNSLIASILNILYQLLNR
ncbi:MAG: hypothetical protein QXL02_01640 [Candidatus Anstonellales archaeon]